MTALARPVNPAPGPARVPSDVPGTQRLLDLDPDLGRLLDRDRYAQARHEVLARVYARPRGPWPMRAVPRDAVAQHLGLLMLDGVIASDVVIDDVVSTELLGAGDIARPWPLEASERLLADEAQWAVLSDCRVAILDHRLAGVLSRYPEIYAVLMERMDQRARRLARTQAIAELNRVDRRVLWMLWQLAERWGRVTAGGVLIPLDISHRLLGQLVGARRPTVSTALGELARAGSVERRGDGAWLLHGEPPGGHGTPAQNLLSRRRLFVEHRAKPDDTPGQPAGVDDLELRLRRLRREADTLQAELARRCESLTGPREAVAAAR